MGEDSNKFDSYVRRSILLNNQFDIEDVRELKSIKSMYFDKEKYSKIEGLIKAHNLQAIMGLPSETVKSDEYLEVMTFSNQDDKQFAVTVYDSIELWQDPQVIEIFPLE